MVTRADVYNPVRNHVLCAGWPQYMRVNSSKVGPPDLAPLLNRMCVYFECTNNGVVILCIYGMDLRCANYLFIEIY